MRTRPLRHHLAPALLSIALLCLGVTPGRAAQFEVLSAWEPRRAVIVVTGEIVQGDLARFRTALREARRTKGEAAPLLLLHSPGGSLQQGLSIAAEVRSLGVATAVLPLQSCMSACSMIFFGGFDARLRKPDRTAYGFSRVGVHLWKRKPNGPAQAEPVRGTAPGAPNDPMTGAVRQFYREMRVSDEIWQLTIRTPHNAIRLLTPEEMTRSDIATRSPANAPIALTAPAIRCKPICLPLHAAAAPYRLPLTVGEDTADAAMSGRDFLQRWPTLFARRVRIDSCTLWTTADDETWCMIEEQGRPMPLALVAAAQPRHAASTQLRARCATPAPAEACRIELSGTVRISQRGPILYQARAKLPGTADRRAQAGGGREAGEDGRQRAGSQPLLPTL